MHGCNAAGIVWGLFFNGKKPGLHFWSVAIKENGKVEMIEPQTGGRDRK